MKTWKVGDKVWDRLEKRRGVILHVRYPKTSRRICDCCPSTVLVSTRIKKRLWFLDSGQDKHYKFREKCSYWVHPSQLVPMPHGAPV